MTGFKRGSVVLIRYPNSDLKTYKKRPALVVLNDELCLRLNQTIVVMITTNLSRSGPTRVPVKVRDLGLEKMGLRSDSIIVTDNLATVLHREIDKVIGECPIMSKVEEALRLTFGIADEGPA